MPTLQEIRLAICDDEQIYIDHICQYLAAYESDSGNRLIVERYSSPLHLLEVLGSGEKQYDILLLDVDMPQMQGTDAAMEIRKFNKEIPICFVTGYEDYALKAFKVDAVGYLVKPVKYMEFKHLIDRCAIQIQYARDREAAEERYYSIRTERGEAVIPMPNIMYIEKRRNKCVFHLVNGEVTSYDTLSKVYGKLNHTQFYYTHQGYIVNFAHIKEVRPDKIYLAGDLEIPVSRRYYQGLRELHMDKVKRLLAERKAELLKKSQREEEEK